MHDFNFFPPQLVMCIHLFGEKKNDLDLEKSLRIVRVKELKEQKVKEIQRKNNLTDELNVLKYK